MPSWVRWIWLTLAALGGLWLLWRLTEIVLLLALALVLTCALGPVVDRLGAAGLPRGGAAAVAIGAIVGLLAAAFTGLAPIVIDQASQLVEALSSLDARLAWIEAHWEAWRRGFPLLPDFAAAYAWATGAFAGSVQATLGLTSRFLLFMAGAFTVLFLAFFFLRDRELLLAQVLRIVPAGRRTAVSEVLTRIGARVGDYVLGQLVVMGVVGSLTTAGLVLMGVPYAVTLGMLAGMLEIVPYFGPVAAAFPGLMLAFAASWQLGLTAMAWYLVVQQVEAFLVTPTVQGRAVGLHPVWIMLALLTGGSLMGLPGVVLAVPAAVTLQILLEELVLPRVVVERVAIPEGVEPPV